MGHPNMVDKAERTFPTFQGVDMLTYAFVQWTYSLTNIEIATREKYDINYIVGFACNKILHGMSDLA